MGYNHNNCRLIFVCTVVHRSPCLRVCVDLPPPSAPPSLLLLLLLPLPLLPLRARSGELLWRGCLVGGGEGGMLSVSGGMPSLVDRAVFAALADDVLLDVSLEEHRAARLRIPVSLRRAASSTSASTSGPVAPALAPLVAGVSAEALLRAEQTSRAEEAAWAAHLAKGGGSTKASSKARVDIFGKSHPAVAADNVTCPHCARPVVAGRYAPHLEKCMGRGRKAARVANAGFALGGRRSSGAAEGGGAAGMLAADVGPDAWGDEAGLPPGHIQPVSSLAVAPGPAAAPVFAPGVGPGPGSARALPPYAHPQGWPPAGVSPSVMSVASLPIVGSGRPLPVPQVNKPAGASAIAADGAAAGGGTKAAGKASGSKSKGSKASKAALEKAEKAAQEKAAAAASVDLLMHTQPSLPADGEDPSIPSFMDFDGDVEVAMPMDLSVLGDFGGDDDWLAGLG